MFTKNSTLILSIILSWISLITMVILFGIQTNSVNGTMVATFIIIPLILYLPMIFQRLPLKIQRHNKMLLYFQEFLLTVSTFCFILSLIIYSFISVYANYIRWGMVIVSVIGLIFNMVILYIKMHSKKLRINI